jgi:hypothetical protein
MKRWEIKTRWLEPDYIGDWVLGTEDWVCGSSLNSLFDIPEEAKHIRIWASSHSDRSAQAIYLKYTPNPECTLDWGTTKNCQEIVLTSLEKWAIKQGKKLGLFNEKNKVVKVYVSVEWK